MDSSWNPGRRRRLRLWLRREDEEERDKRRPLRWESATDCCCVGRALSPTLIIFGITVTILLTTAATAKGDTLTDIAAGAAGLFVVADQQIRYGWQNGGIPSVVVVGRWGKTLPCF